jgi:uncharacterized protein YegP (UPF0339 family)
MKEGTQVAGTSVVQKSSNGQYFFVLKAGNGERIAQSETYNSKAAALNGIESVKANAPTAPVEDQTAE